MRGLACTDAIGCGSLGMTTPLLHVLLMQGTAKWIHSNPTRKDYKLGKTTS